MYISEIFESFHGEVNGHHQGRKCTFIRKSGCNLRCSYCDTKETWDQFNGKDLSFDQILVDVEAHSNEYICFTGGEPLYGDRELMVDLLCILSEKGYKISVETNGTIDITPFARFVDSFVIDYKFDSLPSFYEPNLINLRSTDVIKFCVANHEETEEGINYTNEIIREKYKSKALVAFSPIISDTFTPSELSDILLFQHSFDCVLSLQIHKIVNFK